MSRIEVRTGVTGIVWKILKEPGDHVSVGEVLLIIESMKMEIPIESEEKGRIQEVLVKENEVVAEGQPVVIIEG